MKTQKIALNLIVVDFETTARDVLNWYYTDLNNVYGLDESSITTRDKSKMLLYFTLETVTKIQKDLNNYKNTIFYINKNANIDQDVINKLLYIAKSIPIPIYQDTVDFNVLSDKTGETIELTNNIKQYRFNFDFSKYSQRKIKLFFEKHKTNSKNPALKIPSYI